MFFDIREMLNSRKRSGIAILEVGKEVSVVFFPVFNGIFFCSGGEFFYPEGEKRSSNGQSRVILTSENTYKIWKSTAGTEKNMPKTVRNTGQIPVNTFRTESNIYQTGKNTGQT